MKRASLFVFLLACLISTPRASQAEEPKPDPEHTDFAAIDRKWQDAEKNGDVDFCEKFFAKSYVLVKSNGEIVDRKQWLDTLRSPGRPVLEELTPDQVEVHAFNDVVVLVDHTTLKGHDGKGNVISGEFRVLRVLLWEDGQWKAAGVSMKRLDPAAQ